MSELENHCTLNFGPAVSDSAHVVTRKPVAPGFIDASAQRLPSIF